MHFRRGFTFQGAQQQIAPPTAEEEIKIRGEGDACAYYFWLKQNLLCTQVHNMNRLNARLFLERMFLSCLIKLPSFC